MTSVQVPGGGGPLPSGPAHPAQTIVPPARHTQRGVLRGWILTGVAVMGLLVAGLVISAYFQLAYGFQTALLALLVALLPLVIVIPTFLWLDRFEAEPVRNLVFAFLWGALVAALIAALINTSAMAVLGASSAPESATALTAVVVAPVVEEAAKGIFILLVWWLAKREFDGVIDGMVYAGIVAAGFAFTENIQYLAQAYSEGGRAMLTMTFVLRCVMSPFAHPMFTVLTGIGVGVAAVSRPMWIKIGAPVGGYLLAVLAHALWNLAAVSAGQGYLLIYALIEVPIFATWVGLILWARHREGRLIGTHLRPYADAGWLSPGEVVMLASMGRRREARMWARANNGRPGLAAMRAFQDAASELALLRQKMTVGHVDEQALTTERTLLTAVVAQRRQFVGQAML